MPAQRPVCHVLIASGDGPFLNRWLETLRRSADAESAERFCCSLVFNAVESREALLESASRDGRLQAVIIDVQSFDRVSDLVAVLKNLRSELDCFLAVPPGVDASAIRRWRLAGELLDRDEDHPEHLLRQIHAAIARRARTPFADTLRDYVESARDAWHTPGHSGGDALRESPWVGDFYRQMGEHIFHTDLSVSVQELDSLLEPHSVIQEAQDLAAQAFGSRRTFFVTNGTSTANKVVIQHLLGSGGKVIIDQACHKSIHHAVVLFGASPVYLPASVNRTYGFYGPVHKQRILDAIDAHPDARLLVLTSCTYDGFYYDLKPIVEYAHGRGIRVFIDEAWYAHGRFHPDLRPCALDSGADYVTQSTHKTLSAFSQASMIHIGDRDFDEQRFREHLNMHTSTSPQYAMIASLDVARKQMSMEGFGLLSRCLGHVQQLRASIDQTGVFRVLSREDMLPEELSGDGVRLDPTKLSIDASACAVPARQLQLELFERYGIQVEKATHNTLLVLVTMGTTQSKVLRLVNALEHLASEHGTRRGGKPLRQPALPPLTEIERLPRDAYFGQAEMMPLMDESHSPNPALVGRVCADQVVPYPPGIPVLVPGQRISLEAVRYLLERAHGDSGVELHGLCYQDGEPVLRVASQKE